MTAEDFDYVQRLIQSGLVAGPVLELGVGYGGDTCRELVESSGLRYYGTDMNAAKDVDFVANFERAEDMAVFQSVAPFSTVLILNVLEHTFDPIRILDHARTLVRRGGTLVVVTPAIWPLHNFPFDAWRILPNFYEEYARRTRLHLVDEYFEYLGIGAVRAFRSADSAYAFPPPCRNAIRRFWGRAVHKALNTFGRGMSQPSHVGVGAVFVVSDVM